MLLSCMFSLSNCFKILFIFVLFTKAKCECGYPGLPEYSQLISPKLYYAENETVIYKCNDYPDYYKNITRKCFKGSWIGVSPRCGKKIHVEINHLVIRPKSNNISRTLNSSNYTMSLEEDHEIESKEPIFINESITIEIVLDKNYIINMIEVWFDLNNAEVNTIFANVTNRECYLDHKTKRWTNLITFFVCDSAQNNKGNIVPDVISISLSARSLSSTKLKKLVAYQYSDSCGQIERPVYSGVEFIDVNSSSSYYELKCNQNYNFIPADGSPPDRTWHIYCGSDAKWLGSFPKCKPKIDCPLIEISKKSIGIDYKNLLYSNNSLAYEVHHLASFTLLNNSQLLDSNSATHAIHSCVNGTEKIYLLVGANSQECMPNAQWSRELPFCSSIFNFITKTNNNIVISFANSSTNSPFKLVIIIMVTALGLISVSVISLILCASHRRRKIKSRKVVPMDQVKSVIYDDVMDNRTSEVFDDNQQTDEMNESDEDQKHTESFYEVINENDYQVIDNNYENIEISKSNKPSNSVYDDTRMGQPIYTMILP